MFTKKIFFILKIIILYFVIVNNSYANTLIERKINGYSAKIIEHKTDSQLYDIKIGIHPKDGGTLRSIMGTVGGITGVNGVFECPKDYPSCGGKNYTINERYVNGEKKFKYKSTGDRVVFGWNKNIEPFLFQTDTINKNKEKEIWEGFANHPLLLKDGEVQLDIYHKKGLIDYKMKKKSVKNFICSNKNGTKIFFGFIYNITIDETAIALKDFGCWNAINLDAGYSTTFIYNGKYVIKPQRDILDGVFIVPKNMDTKKIENTAKNIMSTLLTKTKNQTYTQKINFLRKINSTLTSMSQKIYKQHTSPVFEEKKIYTNTIIIENIDTNISAQKLILTEDFKKSEILFIKNNNIYKREFERIEKKKTGTKIEINSTKTLEKIYVINLLRTYTAEIIPVYQKIEKLRYIKKLDLNLNVDVSL